MNSPEKDLKKIAQDFMDELLQGDFTSAWSRFDEDMKNALNQEQLEEAWINTLAPAGALLQQNEMDITQMEGYHMVTICYGFQRADIEVKIVFKKEGKISGLNFIPTTTEYHPPDYVDPSSFREVEVTVGEGRWVLPGTLSMPAGPGPFPGVVLVHGSGPNDQDETIGPNKIFRDLAGGLASRGIAVLRYNKRTFQYAKELTAQEVEDITVKEEVIEDALAAIHLLRHTEKIDPQRVFLSGHSLGATLAPRIGREDNNLAGIILMAGITRSLEETILDQYTYLYNLKGEISKKEQAELDDLKEKVEKLKDPDFVKNITRQDLPLNMPVNYWKDLREHDPSSIIKSLDMDILVLQGGRDYQVLEPVDFKGWKDALKNKDNASFQVFPSLNHLFIAGEGKSTPQEYLVEGHVEKEVIDCMVEWIN